MGDYYPGDIDIGGQLKHKDLEDFIEVLVMDGVMDSSYTSLDEEEIKEAIKEACDQKEMVRFFNNEASYGSFPNVEDWCRAHKLAYCRHSEAKYEYDAENVWWKPGMKEPQSVKSDQDGSDSFISVEDIQKCLKGKSAEQQVKRLKKLIADKSPTKLPPLEITGVPDEASTVS